MRWRQQQGWAADRESPLPGGDQGHSLHPPNGGSLFQVRHDSAALAEHAPQRAHTGVLELAVRPVTLWWLEE